MEKIWLKSYPRGITESIELDRYRSLAHMFDGCAGRFGELPAFANMGASLSFAELNIESYNFAAFLQAELGLKKGERIAIMLPNLLQFPVAMYGALRAGLVVVNINPQYTARELGHYLKDSGAKAIVILENFADVLEEIVADTPVEHVILTRVGDMLHFPKSAIVNFVLKHVRHAIPKHGLDRALSFKRALVIGQGRQLIKPDLAREDLAFLQFTGGTTGLAKGAMLTHGNLLANVAQAAAWFKPILNEREELVITALPLYHVFALTANCFLFTYLGGLNYLITDPRNMPGFVKELSKVKFSVITGVNTLFNGLLNTDGFAGLDFSRLKVALGGGMAVQQVVAEAWQKTTGRVLTEAYGLTETSPAVTINPIHLKEYNGAIGLPLPNTEVSIQDDDGDHLDIGATGELCVRGPQVMRGYWNQPEETQAVLSADGWFRTGDIAAMDDAGFVRIVDRKKDMILVSGFNVYPNEIESVVAAHDGVLEVAAVGVDDAESGEVVKLYIVKKSPALTEQNVLDYCKEHLTRYKWPKHIEFRDELPKTNVGKILRRALRDGPHN